MPGIIDGNPEGCPSERFSIIRFCRDNIFLLLFVSGTLFSLYYAVQGWNGSLMEKYAFRQAQTALTVQHLLRGGPLLAYETPVLGPPWSIPLEFPFYQYMVFLAVKLTGTGIEQAGRLISLLFFISTLYPFYFLIKSLFVKPAKGICRGARDTDELRRKTLAEFSSHFPAGAQIVSFQWCDFYFKPRSQNL